MCAVSFPMYRFFCEIICAVITGLLSMPLGVMQFIPIYHPLHDSLGIHSEVCVLMLVVAYMLIVWSADRYPFETARVHGYIGQLFRFLYVTVVQNQVNISVNFHLPVATFTP